MFDCWPRTIRFLSSFSQTWFPRRLSSQAILFLRRNFSPLSMVQGVSSCYRSNPRSTALIHFIVFTFSKIAFTCLDSRKHQNLTPFNCFSRFWMQSSTPSVQSICIVKIIFIILRENIDFPLFYHQNKLRLCHRTRT